jgi:hypothetical protein
LSSCHPSSLSLPRDDTSRGFSTGSNQFQLTATSVGGGLRDLIDHDAQIDEPISVA